MPNTGRWLRSPTDQTDLTTVTVSVTEIKDYVPDESPAFASRARRAFQNSTAAFVRTVQALSLALVALVPWLPFPVVVVLLIYGLCRIRRRRAR
jgi:hypothetical protein